jgi:hypothetical protein
MIPPMRISQCLLHPWDQATPLTFTQVLLDNTEAQDVEAFAKIEEVELQHAVNITGTSTEAAGSSQNAGGASHQSS